MHSAPDRASAAEHPEEKQFHLPTEPFKGTPEEIERQWFEKVYKGRGDSMSQLTWRAIIMGSLLGGVLSLTNLYIGLKTGWGFGVSITACILSYAIWTTFQKIGLVKTPMTILENNCMQSAASAAGYSTGSTLISAFAAYILLNGKPLSTPLTLAWVFFLALLGVTMAIPMKRQMVNVEQLPFPTGTASAETLQVLHAHSGKGMRAAMGLIISALIAALDKFWADGFMLVSKLWSSMAGLKAFSSATLIDKLQDKVLGAAYPLWQGRTMTFNWDLTFIGAGALTGIRVCTSMLISATLCWGVFIPVLQNKGIVPAAGGFRDCVQWSLWGGTACMVSSGLLSFLLQWRSTLRAFRNLGTIFKSRKSGTQQDEMEAIETPFSWFLAGQLVSLIALAILAHMSFGMHYWQSALAVALSFILAVVACRVTGETDTTPIGAMGKVTQLTFGAINPGNVNLNLMAANITSGAAISSADLLTDLKSGYLLGANPRKQFLAQFSGIFIGTVVTVLSFRALVPSGDVLNGQPFAAPSAQTWAAVAKALSHGFAEIAPLKRWSMLVGALLGVVLTILPMIFKKQQKWIPSAAGVGLAWVFEWNASLMFFIGALIAWGVELGSKKTADEFTYP
ncbi:MAG: hypothetical protein RLY20_496, partial [Verrucomicrobiota bacterium]